MAEYLLLFVALLGLAVCIADWRKGFSICLLVGCLQDPIRKIIPDEPIYITSTILLYVAATCLGAYLKGRRFNLQAIHSWNSSLRIPLALFFVLVMIKVGQPLSDTEVQFSRPLVFLRI